jgi:hypothetical protein
MMMLMVVVPTRRMVRVCVMYIFKRRRHAVLRIIFGNVQQLLKEEQLPQILAAIIIDEDHFDCWNE